MILDAQTLDGFQRCKRRWAIEQKEGRGRWNPKALLDFVLKPAILAISQGNDHEKVTSTAITEFLEKCAAPGLDVEGDPYPLARDFQSLITTLLEALAKASKPLLKAGPSILLGRDFTWRCRAFQDETGTLHRFATVDHMDRDAISRELHGWNVFGDVACADVPLVLHVFEIGRRSNGRQHSPWCKAYRHPAIPNRIAFSQKDGSRLQGDWKAVWYQDVDKRFREDWLAMMERDGINLIHSIEVQQVSNAVREDTIRQIRMEAVDMVTYMDVSWQTIPLSRGHCDVPFVCQHQSICYGALGKSDVGTGRIPE